MEKMLNQQDDGQSTSGDDLCGAGRLEGLLVIPPAVLTVCCHGRLPRSYPDEARLFSVCL